MVVLDHDLNVVAANGSARKVFADLSTGVTVSKAISRKRGFISRLAQVLQDRVERRVTARMVELVTDLLSLSQVEVKQRRRPKKTVDPNLIVAQAMNAVRQRAAKRGMTLVCHATGPPARSSGPT